MTQLLGENQKKLIVNMEENQKKNDEIWQILKKIHEKLSVKKKLKKGEFDGMVKTVCKLVKSKRLCKEDQFQCKKNFVNSSKRNESKNKNSDFLNKKYPVDLSIKEKNRVFPKNFEEIIEESEDCESRDEWFEEEKEEEEEEIIFKKKEEKLEFKLGKKFKNCQTIEFFCFFSLLNDKILAREYLRKISPKIQQYLKDLFLWSNETFKKKKKRYRLRLSNMIKNIKKNKKFPEFREDPTLEMEISEGEKVFPFWKIKSKEILYLSNYYYYKYFWKRNYEQSLKEGKFENNLFLAQKIYIYLLSKLRYQKENILSWSEAKKFNENSSKIFAYFLIENLNFKKL